MARIIEFRAAIDRLGISEWQRPAHLSTDYGDHILLSKHRSRTEYKNAKSKPKIEKRKPDKISYLRDYQDPWIKNLRYDGGGDVVNLFSGKPDDVLSSNTESCQDRFTISDLELAMNDETARYIVHRLQSSGKKDGYCLDYLFRYVREKGVESSFSEFYNVIGYLVRAGFTSKHTKKARLWRQQGKITLSLNPRFNIGEIEGNELSRVIQMYELNNAC